MATKKTSTVESTEETKKDWFTKTKAREALEEKLTSMVSNGLVSAEAAAELNKLFEGKSRNTETSTVTVDGVIVAKRCSYFGVFMPIDEFGTVGKDEKGDQKYGYQSKLAASIVRARKTKAAEMLKAADEALEENEDIAAWKEAKAEAAEYESEKVAIQDTEYDGESWETIEEAQAAFAE